MSPESLKQVSLSVNIREESNIGIADFISVEVIIFLLMMKKQTCLDMAPFISFMQACFEQYRFHSTESKKHT